MGSVLLRDMLPPLEFEDVLQQPHHLPQLSVHSRQPLLRLREVGGDRKKTASLAQPLPLLWSLCFLQQLHQKYLLLMLMLLPLLVLPASWIGEAREIRKS